mmetsp:Transcript_67623/g.159211  ORF Transcript_67623/g.159211 Transcript_67623/m.159211 type:complete len:213 (+) Transcript_67623:498-1136(+)
MKARWDREAMGSFMNKSGSIIFRFEPRPSFVTPIVEVRLFGPITTTGSCEFCSTPPGPGTSKIGRLFASSPFATRSSRAPRVRCKQLLTEVTAATLRRSSSACSDSETSTASVHQRSSELQSSCTKVDHSILCPGSVGPRIRGSGGVGPVGKDVAECSEAARRSELEDSLAFLSGFSSSTQLFSPVFRLSCTPADVVNGGGIAPPGGVCSTF